MDFSAGEVCDSLGRWDTARDCLNEVLCLVSYASLPDHLVSFIHSGTDRILFDSFTLAFKYPLAGLLASLGWSSQLYCSLIRGFVFLYAGLISYVAAGWRSSELKLCTLANLK